VSAPAEVGVERRDGLMVASVSGEIDMTNAGYVRDELLRSVPNDARALVVSFDGCTYIDSAGIEVVFDIARRLGRRRQALHVVLGPASPLRRVLELTDVGSVAPLHDSLDEAVAAVG
jgi:anti-sigma B factor antagonist